MQVQVMDHPLVAHKLTLLRDVQTQTPTFRQLTDELVTLLAYEATRGVAVEECHVTTPLVTTTGTQLRDPQPIIVPILRAGLGMLDGMMRLLPNAPVGFLGMVRDEESLEATTYANRLPNDLSGRQVFLLDPMLATGGSLIAAVRYVAALGARDITAICLLAAPEGVDAMHRELADLENLNLVIAGLDEKLNDVGYILPGLGDAGDRLFGAI